MIVTITIEQDDEYTRLQKVGNRPDLALILRDAILRLAEQYPGARMERLAEAVAGVERA